MKNINTVVLNIEVTQKFTEPHKCNYNIMFTISRGKKCPLENIPWVKEIKNKKRVPWKKMW